MPRRGFSFEGARGDRLAAVVDAPAEVRAWALFAHCFTCSKDLRAARTLALALAGRGIGVVRFDFTGLGESEGDFAETNFSSSLDDLERAAEAMVEHAGEPSLLIGHSLGGTAALAVAASIPSCRAVVTLAAPSDPGVLLRSVLPDEAEVGEDDTTVEIAGRPFRVRRQLFRDLERHSLGDRIHELGRALLVLHSPQDAVVGIDHARRIFDAARHPKSFVALDGADHLLSRDQDAIFAADMIASWSGRYVELEEPAAGELRREGEVWVHSLDGLAQEIRTGNHELRADEPVAVGGDDSGPTPYQLLLAGLGACVSMTVGMYARRKEWPLEGVEVRLSHDKIHARDCADCETREGRVDRITKEVRFEGPLSAEQLARLTQIASRCPVHRTLESEIRIVDRGGPAL